MYEITFVVQTLSQMCLALGFCTSTTFSLCAAMLVCAQYDILCCSIKNLPYTAMIKNGKHLKTLRLMSF